MASLPTLAGCLVLVVLAIGPLGVLLLVSWLAESQRVAWVLFQLIALLIGLRLIIGMLVILLGVYLPASEVAFESSVWGVAEEYGDARLERCRAFMLVPGVLQTVQRAEFWGAILALLSYWPCHLGVDNLNVARSIEVYW